MPGKESDGSGDTPNGHDPGSLRIPTTGSGGALSPSAELAPPKEEELERGSLLWSGC